MLDTVLWDIDGTLMNFKKSESAALKKALGDAGYCVSDEEVSLYSEINASCWRRYEKGELDYNGIFTCRFKEFFEKINRTFNAEAINDVYRKCLGEIYFLEEGATDVMEKIRALGIRQYIVTNGYAETQMKKATSSGLLDIADGIFISGIIGSPKPEKRFFDVCFEEIGNVNKEKTVIIGDSLTSDIKGGINAGILTCLYDPEQAAEIADVKPDYQITSLYEALEIVQKK